MGFKNITGNLQFDFQINRVLTYGEIACDEAEIMQVAKDIDGLPSWFSTWYKLGEKAEKEARFLHAAYYFRLAEFFLSEKDENKTVIYERCIKNYHKIISKDKSVQEIFVPYQGTTMKTLIFEAESEKGTIVMFGGYDSFAEEFYLAVKAIVKNGYKVILFEGPGQGQTLKNGLTFEYRWELPTGAILDFFNLKNVRVIGVSWGGYLALRAAAFDKRIQGVVAYDILYDGFDCMLNLLSSPARILIRGLFALKQRYLINSLLKLAIKKSVIADWAITHGQYITGTSNGYDFYNSLRNHTLKGLLSEIQCDVLLLAGEKDHYIPASHYDILMKNINNARSLKGRVFTEEEGGEQHCQVGHHELAIDCILDWLNDFV